MILFPLDGLSPQTELKRFDLREFQSSGLTCTQGFKELHTEHGERHKICGLITIAEVNSEWILRLPHALTTIFSPASAESLRNVISSNCQATSLFPCIHKHRAVIGVVMLELLSEILSGYKD